MTDNTGHNADNTYNAADVSAGDSTLLSACNKCTSEDIRWFDMVLSNLGCVGFEAAIANQSKIRWNRKDNREKIINLFARFAQGNMDPTAFRIALLGIARQDPHIDYNDLVSCINDTASVATNPGVGQSIPNGLQQQTNNVTPNGSTKAFTVAIPPSAMTKKQSIPSTVQEDCTLTISPSGGQFVSPQTLAISCKSKKAELHYTIDGNEPTLKSPRYTGTPLVVDRTVKLQVTAFINGNPVQSIDTLFEFNIGQVSISPATGTYHPPITVALSCATPNCEIRYTTDGTEPSESSNVYKDRFLVKSDCTIQARAFRNGSEPGPIESAIYTLQKPEWKVLEPTENEDPVRPHDISKVLDIGNGLNAVGASVRGKLHAHSGTWRDDSFAIEVEGPWTIIVVSDGAGSAAKSRVGSRLICEASMAKMKMMLHNYTIPPIGDKPSEINMRQIVDFLVGAARDSLDSIRREAAARTRQLKDFHATLRIAVHCLWQDTDFVATIQVGDGSTAKLQSDNVAKIFIEPDHGEYSAGTLFLTSNKIEQSLPTRVKFSLSPIQCLAVMTDGVSDDFFPEDQRIIDLFTRKAIPGMEGKDGESVDGVMHCIVPSADPASALLEWLKYEKRQSADDRTLVLLYRGGKQ